MKSKPKLKRGFAAMSPKDVRRVCRMGGLTVSRNRRHMKLIGSVGGKRTQARHRKNARLAREAAKSPTPEFYGAVG